MLTAVLVKCSICRSVFQCGIRCQSFCAPLPGPFPFRIRCPSWFESHSTSVSSDSLRCPSWFESHSTSVSSDSHPQIPANFVHADPVHRLVRAIAHCPQHREPFRLVHAAVPFHDWAHILKTAIQGSLRASIVPREPKLPKNSAHPKTSTDPTGRPQGGSR